MISGDTVHQVSDEIFCILLSLFARSRVDRRLFIPFSAAIALGRRPGLRSAESFAAYRRGVGFSPS
jgi:hypothetical protein